MIPFDPARSSQLNFAKVVHWRYMFIMLFCLRFLE